MVKPDSKAEEAHSETSSVITMKEYANSEYPASEPPPAYIKPRSTALQIARLAAFTIIVSAVILGGFILAASWIEANAARNLDLTLNQELLEDLQPSYEHLIANEALSSEADNNVRQDNAPAANKVSERKQEKEKVQSENKESENHLQEALVPPPQSQEDNKQLPLELDEIASMLMQKNMKGRVNCIVEKRRNEELVDHAPRSLNLPFGLNITTPPRLQHLTGEQMVVICKDDDDEKQEEKEQEQIQPVIFPLPSHLMNQIQQVPQIIPLNQLLQQIPQQNQQQPLFYPQQQQVLPQVQQIYPQAQQIYPQQEQMYTQPQQQQQIYPQIQQLFPQPQMYHQPQPQQQFVYHSIPQYPQQVEVDNQVQERPMPEIVPIKEVRFNQNRVPLNHILANPVSINPMAVNDVPLMQMPLTHMPMKEAPQVRNNEHPDAPITMNEAPAHHLVPPQPQDMQIETFNQQEDKPDMFRPAYHGRPMVNRPYPFPPRMLRGRPTIVEVREPRVINLQEQRERMPFPAPPSDFRMNQNRIPDFRMRENENQSPEFPVNENRMPEFRAPVQGRVLPLPFDFENKERMPFYPKQNRMEDSRENRESFPRPIPFLPESRLKTVKIIKMIPLNLEGRKPFPEARRVRFPEIQESEENNDNSLPIITQITKIIPIRIEKEENKMKRLPLIPVPRDSAESSSLEIKSINEIDNKVEKNDSPFPIPINAILDMIFRGIRPLMNQRGPSPFPIPIDIKIERIEKHPVEAGTGKPVVEIFEKEIQNVHPVEVENIPAVNSNHPEMPRPNDLLLDENEGRVEKVEAEEQEKKETTTPVQVKMEKVPVFEKEQEDTQPIPIPADAEDAQVFKLEDSDTVEIKEDPEPWQKQDFLPNGQGRGARAFPIPQQVRESEIFSVIEARNNMNIPLATGFKVENPADNQNDQGKPAETQDRQARVMNFPMPVEGEVNLFPEGRAMKPLSIPTNSDTQPQTFTIDDARRSIRLLPVPNPEPEAMDKPVSASPAVPAESDEMRPHYVQPRSV